MTAKKLSTPDNFLTKMQLTGGYETRDEMIMQALIILGALQRESSAGFSEVILRNPNTQDLRVIPIRTTCKHPTRYPSA